MQVAAIEKIILSQNLKVEKDLLRFSLSRKDKPVYTSLAETHEGQKVVFRCATDIAFNHLIKKEIFIYSIEGYDCFPSLVSTSSSDNDLAWLTYRYVPFETAGNTYQYKHDTNFRDIYRFLRNLPKIGETISRQVELSPWLRAEYWSKIFSNVEMAFPENSAIKFLMPKIRSNFDLLSKDFFMHGDFHPGNIFFGDDKIFVIDWESSGLYPKGFDHALTWVRCYNKEARSEVLMIIEETYGKIDQSIITVLNLCIIRDLLEWHQVELGMNPLLKSSEMINDVEVSTIKEDLMTQLEKFISMY